MSSSNPKQNNKQDAVPSRGPVIPCDEVEVDSYAARREEHKDAVRSPERAKKNTFFGERLSEWGVTLLLHLLCMEWSSDGEPGRGARVRRTPRLAQ